MSNNQESDETGDSFDGLDPTEEVGPERSEVSPDDCAVPPTEGGQQHEQVGFIEELGEGYTPEDIAVAIHPDDGLPFTPDAYQELATAPAFTYDNMVCVEDARIYVELFRGECNWDGPLRDPYDSEGQNTIREVFIPSAVRIRFGVPVVITTKTHIVPVRPIRPRCSFYKRQVFLNDDQPDPNEPGNKIIFRNCSIRNSVGGASMSLRDQAVLACDWRSPQDPITTKRHLDLFDEEKLNGDAHTKKIPLFGNRES